MIIYEIVNVIEQKTHSIMKSDIPINIIYNVNDALFGSSSGFALINPNIYTHCTKLSIDVYNLSDFILKTINTQKSALDSKDYV